ncbi:hypothetical protein, partial [Streptomyces sp. NPDC000851]
DEALVAAVELSDRYLTDRRLPDKAIDLIDQAGLSFAWAGTTPARAAQKNGSPTDLPELDPRRDGSGVSLAKPVASVAGPV